MKQIEALLGKILSAVIFVAGIAFIIMWRQQQQVMTTLTNLSVDEARIPTLLLFIPGVLMIFLGIINFVPEHLRPRPGSPMEVAFHKLLSVIIMIGGIVFVIMWGWQQQLLLTQANVTVDGARTPTLLLFIPGTLFIALGVVNLLPDSLRGLHHARKSADTE